MATAKWNGKIIAESDAFELVEGNIYFPREALNHRFFKESPHTSICPWKGIASYLDVVVDGSTNENAAWYYPHPKDAAKNITGFVAFWKGIEVHQ
ncbi:MAG TPA: DUF427 domain-containing protein [Methylotenera sp.]|nr:DUF427 domain-containing protein [Methylotenera sp.]